ncbi:MAG: DUF4307 domain-containing protein [Microbacteriaceae bacterium]|nr:DUF4307 domain-containing protein [Microbacteriaceae bacterium]
MPQLCVREVNLKTMTNETLMRERYGKSSSSSRRNIAILAVALLTFFFGWATWVTFLAPSKAIPKVQGYEVESPQLTKVRFTLDKPVGTTAVCAAEVMNSSFAVVGYRQVMIEPDAGASEVLEVLVNTTQLGVTGLVEKCWVK